MTKNHDPYHKFKAAFRLLYTNHFIGGTCLFFSALTLLLAHVMSFQGLILTRAKSNALYDEVLIKRGEDPENPLQKISLENPVGEEIDRLAKERSFICEAYNNMHFGYTCEDYPVIEFIISYFTNMMTFLFFGFFSIWRSPLFAYGTAMTLPYIIAWKYVKHHRRILAEKKKEPEVKP